MLAQIFGQWPYRRINLVQIAVVIDQDKFKITKMRFQFGIQAVKPMAQVAQLAVRLDNAYDG